MERIASGLRTSAGRRGLRHGVAPTVRPQVILRRLAPQLVLDVGANRGQFALDVVTACPNARIVSFEPLEPEAGLWERVLGGVPNARIVRSAVGSVAGTAQLFISAQRDSSSLRRPTELQSRLFRGTHHVASVDVPVCTLDGVVSDSDVPERTLLKIDAQGYELDVLRGAPSTLSRIAWVYLEVSLGELYEGQALASDVFEELQSRGFRLADLTDPVRRNGRAVQFDALFERNDRQDS